MIRDILQYPHPGLAVACEPVGFPLDADATAVCSHLLDTMRKHRAYGLSAPQIGFRLCIASIGGHSGFPWPVIINPEILETAGGLVLDAEGCLSIEHGVPRMPVRRHKSVRVAFWNRSGHHHAVWAHGLPARVLQHEIDHLHGRMINDEGRT